MIRVEDLVRPLLVYIGYKLVRAEGAEFRGSGFRGEGCREFGFRFKGFGFRRVGL